MHCHSYR